MKKIIAVCCLSLFPLLPLIASAGASRVESVEIRAVSIVGEGQNMFTVDGVHLRMDKAPLLTGDDLSEARVSAVAGKAALNLSLSPSGAARLKSYSAEHVGEKLALLTPDGHVFMLPQIKVPIDGNGVQITGLKSNEAQDLATLVNQQTK